MKSLEEIRQKLIQIKPLLKEKYHAYNFLIFGSYARGEQHENSDIDILVEFDSTVDMFTFLDVEEELARILGLKVDLGTIDSLKPLIKERILREAIVV